MGVMGEEGAAFLVLLRKMLVFSPEERVSAEEVLDRGG